MSSSFDSLLSVGEVADLFSVSAEMIYKLCNKPTDHPDHLPNLRIGNCRRIRRSDAEAYIERRASRRTSQSPKRPAEKPRFLTLN